MLLTLTAFAGCVVPGVGSSSSGSYSSGRPAPARAAGTAPQEPGLAYCQSGIDCGSGQFCKDRGDGIKLCMGKGHGGAYCKSSIDCGSGMFCKDRGDGLKVCMGKGDRGAFCKSSIDCGSGMFCKNRGDGFKVCM